MDITKSVKYRPLLNIKGYKSSILVGSGKNSIKLAFVLTDERMQQQGKQAQQEQPSPSFSSVELFEQMNDNFEPIQEGVNYLRRTMKRKFIQPMK